MNPRDSLPLWPSQSLKISNRHRIIRRGRKYADSADQGICFIALNADLLRQHQDAKLLIEGYCDERGSHEYNLVLGEKRAGGGRERNHGSRRKGQNELRCQPKGPVRA